MSLVVTINTTTDVVCLYCRIQIAVDTFYAGLRRLRKAVIAFHLRRTDILGKSKIVRN